MSPLTFPCLAWGQIATALKMMRPHHTPTTLATPATLATSLHSPHLHSTLPPSLRHPHLHPPHKPVEMLQISSNLRPLLARLPLQRHAILQRTRLPTTFHHKLPPSYHHPCPPSLLLMATSLSLRRGKISTALCHLSNQPLPPPLRTRTIWLPQSGHLRADVISTSPRLHHAIMMLPFPSPFGSGVIFLLRPLHQRVKNPLTSLSLRSSHPLTQLQCLMAVTPLRLIAWALPLLPTIIISAPPT
jgi:hypothetical protein